MQIAISLPDEQVDDLDALVPGEFRSRAEVVRHAVNAWFATRRRQEIDVAYRTAYAEAPQADDEIDAGRATGRAPTAWQDLDW